VVLLSAGVVASIHEPEYKKKHLTTKAHMLDTFHLLWQKPSVRQMFTVYVLLAFTAEAVWTGYQALYAADGRATSTIGLLFSSIALCSALGSVLFEKHLQTLSATRFYLLYGMAVCATTTLLWQPNVSLRLLAIVPLGLVSGMLYTELRAKTQQHVPNAHHATALSIVSVCMMGTFIIASVCMGQIIQHLGLQAARQFVFVGSFCTLIFAILYLKKSIRSHDA